jgi:hypothetical protein
MINFFRASCLLYDPHAVLDLPIRFSSSLNIASMVSRRSSNFSISSEITLASLFPSPDRSFLCNRWAKPPMVMNRLRR